MLPGYKFEFPPKIKPSVEITLDLNYVPKQKEDTQRFEKIILPKVPAEKIVDNDVIPIRKLPKFFQPVLKDFKSLTSIQQKIFCNMSKDENALLVTPNHQDKTVAILVCILNELQKHYNKDLTRKDNFKITIISLSETLVIETAEILRKFLVPHVDLRLLVGNVKNNLSNDQVESADIIVSTPKKWDFFIKKCNKNFKLNLMVIDSLHGIHDDQDMILEAIIAGIVYKNERIVTQLKENVKDLPTCNTRLVGICFPISNYQVLGSSLNVKAENIFFNNNFIGLKNVQRSLYSINEWGLQTLNNSCKKIIHSEIMDCDDDKRLLIFVHSPYEAETLAEDIKNQFKENTSRVINEHLLNRVRTKIGKISSKSLKNMIHHGLSTYHNNLSESDLNIVTELYMSKFIKILISTIQDSWSLKVSADVVIVKATKMYKPEKDDWVGLSILDVLHMQKYVENHNLAEDKKFILLSEMNEVTSYKLMLQGNFSVRSTLQYEVNKTLDSPFQTEFQSLDKLCTVLNSEITAGAIRNKDEVMKWMKCTFSFSQMLQSPHFNLINLSQSEIGLFVEKYISDIVIFALYNLQINGLVKYHTNSKKICASELAKIATSNQMTYEEIILFKKMSKDINFSQLINFYNSKILEKSIDTSNKEISNEYKKFAIIVDILNNQILKYFTLTKMEDIAMEFLQLSVKLVLTKLAANENVSVQMLHLKDLFVREDLNLWKEYLEYQRGRKDYTQKNNTKRDEEAISRVRKFCHMLKLGLHLEFPQAYVFLKHKDGGFYTSWQYPVMVKLCEAIFAIPLLDYIKNIPLVNQTVMFQINKEVVAKRFKLNTKQYYISIHFNRFNESICPWLIEKIFEIIGTQIDFGNYNGGGISDASGMFHLLHCLKEYFIKTKFCTVDGKRFVKSNGIPSDSLFTFIVASICTIVLMYYLCIRTTKSPPNDLICSESYSLLASDQQWDLKEISKYASEVGFDVNLEKSQCTCDKNALNIPKISFKY